MIPRQSVETLAGLPAAADELGQLADPSRPLDELHEVAVTVYELWLGLEVLVADEGDALDEGLVGSARKSLGAAAARAATAIDRAEANLAVEQEMGDGPSGPLGPAEGPLDGATF
jgi:hypothetical protein